MAKEVDLRSRERTAKNYGPIAVSLRKRKAFLKYLRQTGKVAFSARKAGFADTSYLHKLKQQDEEFAAEWAAAIDAAMDRFEDEAIRRAVEGVDKAVMYKGEVVHYEKEYSDQLLMFMLRAGRPDKFRDNVNVSGTISANIGVAILPMTAPKLEDWERAALDVQANQKLLAPAAPTIDQEGNVVSGPTLVRR